MISAHFAAPALASAAANAITPILVFAVIIFLVIAGFFAQKKRAGAIQWFAQSRGLTYEKRNNGWANMDWGYPFGVGGGRKANHVMTGQLNGRPVVTFDYQYTTGSGDDRRTVTTMVTAIQIPRAFPKLEVGLEGATGRLARKLGFKDIEFESEVFNRKYKVECPNRKFASDVLHARFMEWLMSIDSSGFTVAGPYVITHRNGRLAEKAVDLNFSYINAVIDHMPNFVWANAR